MYRARAQQKLLALVALVASAACSNHDVTNAVATTAAGLSIVTATNQQIAAVGAVLAAPLSVMVVDQSGNPASGAAVTWTVLSGGGSLTPSSSTSDVDGLATTTWRLGSAVGVDSVRASLANGQSVVFTASATSGTFANLVLVSGDAQSVTAGSATAPLAVRAVDASGNPVVGVPITWTTTGGGTLSVATGVTDASGMAQVVLTTGTTTGAYTVSAMAGTAPLIVFTGVGM